MRAVSHWAHVTDMTENPLRTFCLQQMRSSDHLRNHISGLFLMQDDARPHVAIVCWQFLEDEGTDAMDWPTTSLEFSPIEHIWDTISGTPHCTTDGPGGGGYAVALGHKLYSSLRPHPSPCLLGPWTRVLAELSWVYRTEGVPLGDHLPPHQEYTLVMLGPHLGTWRTHTRRSLIFTCLQDTTSTLNLYVTQIHASSR